MPGAIFYGNKVIAFPDVIILPRPRLFIIPFITIFAPLRTFHDVKVVSSCVGKVMTIFFLNYSTKLISRKNPHTISRTTVFQINFIVITPRYRGVFTPCCDMFSVYLYYIVRRIRICGNHFFFISIYGIFGYATIGIVGDSLYIVVAICNLCHLGENIRRGFIIVAARRKNQQRYHNADKVFH